MGYPLNLTKPATIQEPMGFAVANDEAEHAALSERGFLPAFEGAPPAPVDEKAEVMAALDAAGIAYDKRLGLGRLKSLLPA